MNNCNWEIKSRRMRWGGGAYRVSVGRPERDHLENLGIDGRILLERTLNKYDEGMDWTDLPQNRRCCSWSVCDKFFSVVSVAYQQPLPMDPDEG
jgi:hypothetical protein